MISRIFGRRRCIHCDQPSRRNSRLVFICGYRIHRACAANPASGFSTWSLS